MAPRPTSASPPDPRRSFQRGLLKIEEVSGILRCSPRHVQRLVLRGRMPAPVRIGALVRWRPDVISRWVCAGCPGSRKEGCDGRS